MSVTDILETMEYGPAPESPQFVNEWLDHHGRNFGQFIGGSWLPSSQQFEVFNPGTGSVLCSAGQADREQVDTAVQAARAALPVWQGLTGEERGRYLYGIARQIQKHSRLFAVLESMDNGKPIRETRDLDIPLAARHFYYHAGWAAMVGKFFPNHQPLGVCGQIIPWNFPLLMLAWKIAPALACGNTVVLKPAEFTPLTGLLFAEICSAAGLPPGVVNIITGDGETGASLVNHPDVNKIAFTGSTEVGRIIRKATAGTGKKLSLELGGKSPFIVFEDADLDGAVEGLVDAIWFNQGQVCCAGSRLLVQESVSEKFLKKVRTRMENLRVGDPLDKAVDIGAIVAPVQLERINELVNKGVEEGAELFQPSWTCPRDGWFYPPTLLTNVEPASTVAQIEIFGPVLVAMSFRTPGEAVELANNTIYGLAASVWTDNINLAHDIAARVKAGTIWVNCTNQFDASSGFGGYRESGCGREGGPEGLREYLKPLAPAPKGDGDGVV
ncbi:MAG: aldehyde dehydrogenase family protein, partial [Fimbriimonadaceae bacterium]